MRNIDIIWQYLNNIGIAITIIILFYILWITSSSFTIFGTGQQIIMGFIVLLLLFRFIKKIKIGTVLDVECKNLLESAESIVNRMKNATKPAIRDNANTFSQEIRSIDDEIKDLKKMLDLLQKLSK